MTRILEKDELQDRVILMHHGFLTLKQHIQMLQNGEFIEVTQYTQECQIQSEVLLL